MNKRKQFYKRKVAKEINKIMEELKNQEDVVVGPATPGEQTEIEPELEDEEEDEPEEDIL